MVKILVFGAQGQLARSLFAVEERADVALVCAHRPETDLMKPASLGAAIARHSPDYVINAAAYTQVDRAESEQDMAYAVNGAAVECMAGECAARDIPLIHISTDYVYDGSKDAPYSEDDATGPAGIYGLSKLAGEEALRASGCRHVILRTAWVFSPYGQNFVKTMLRLAETRDQLDVVCDQSGCPTYAPHLAAGIFRIIDKLSDSRPSQGLWGTYCMAGGGETNWSGFAEEIFACSARLGGPVARVNPIPASAYPTPARRPANSRMNCGRLDAAFGIRLPHWREGTAQCVHSLLDNKS